MMGPIVKAVTEACFLIEEFDDGSDEFWNNRIDSSSLSGAHIRNMSEEQRARIRDKIQFRKRFDKKSGKFYT